jgi:hypothetical protein
MKRLSFFVACELGLMLSLASCGGGGGGGGGGGDGAAADGSQSGAAFTHKTLAGNATTRSTPGTLSASTLAAGSGARASLTNGLSVTGGYTLKAETNGTVTLKSGSSTVATFNASKTNLYTKDGVDFAVMSDTKDVSGGKSTNYVWAGKLNYALFGYWAQISNKSGKKAFENGGTFFFKNGGGLLDGNYANAQYNGANLGTFTGIAAGMAKYDDLTAANADTVLQLMGTASLNITSATSGSLVLNFPNFYKLTGSVTTSASSTIGTSGGISGTFNKFEKNSGNTFPVDLPGSGYTTNTINGQLFGTPSNKVSGSCSFTNGSVCISVPGEAAGTWTLKTANASRAIEVSGAFGVKKK